MTSGSATKLISCCLDKLTAKIAYSGGTAAPNEMLQRPLHSKKCTAWVAMSKRGIIGPFWFGSENGEPVTVTKERYVEVLQSTGLPWAVEIGGASRETASGSSRTGLLPIHPMWPLSGSINILPKDWSFDAKIQSGPLIHLTWTHQTSFYGVIWRTVYMRTTIRQSLN